MTSASKAQSFPTMKDTRSYREEVTLLDLVVGSCWNQLLEPVVGTTDVEDLQWNWNTLSQTDTNTRHGMRRNPSHVGCLFFTGNQLHTDQSSVRRAPGLPPSLSLPLPPPLSPPLSLPSEFLFADRVRIPPVLPSVDVECNIPVRPAGSAGLISSIKTCPALCCHATLTLSVCVVLCCVVCVRIPQCNPTLTEVHERVAVPDVVPAPALLPHAGVVGLGFLVLHPPEVAAMAMMSKIMAKSSSRGTIHLQRGVGDPAAEHGDGRAAGGNLDSGGRWSRSSELLRASGCASLSGWS